MNKELTLLQQAGVFALVCVGLLALAGVWFLYKSFSHQDIKTFAVQGKGEINVEPTKATITADFVGEGNNAEEAKNNLVQQTTKAFAEIEKVGVKKEDVKTQNVSSNPKYEYCYNYGGNMPTWCKNNPSQNRIIGYEASQSFEVKISNNKELVEKVLALFPSLGARNMNGPNWEVDNKAATQQARELAVKEAREKAEGIAKSLGMRLGDVQYYSEDQGGYPVPVAYGKGARMLMQSEVAPAMDSTVPVSAGTDKVVVNVNITYELR